MPIEVKSIIGQVEAHNSKMIVSFNFVSSRPANHIVIFGEATLYDLAENISKLYSAPGPFQITAEPTVAARQLEFENLGRDHEKYPVELVFKVSEVRIHLDVPTLGIEFQEGSKSSLFAFDSHSLGEFRSMLQQTAEKLRFLRK